MLLIFSLLPERSSSSAHAAARALQATYSGVPTSGSSTSTAAPQDSSSSRHSLWSWFKKKQTNITASTNLCAGTRAFYAQLFFHTCTPFLAASWMGEERRQVVWMDAPCCKSSLTHAALPLLQELKRAVAPSAETVSAYQGTCNLFTNIYKHRQDSTLFIQTNSIFPPVFLA